MIEYGGGWEDDDSTKIPLQVQLLDSRPSFYGYFSMRIQEWGIQYVYFEHTVMIRVVQHSCDGPCQRIAWDPGITELGISLTNGDDCIFARGSHFHFPVRFRIGGSTSLVGESLRSCSTSLGRKNV
jgi:hypothetical protein